MELINEKQHQFIRILPYKQYLSDQFKKELGMETGSNMDLCYNEKKILHKCERLKWKFAEFFHG